MNRLRTPTEFGFQSGPYFPPEEPRPLWRTFLVGTLLALIPIVGPAVSAIYIDRRQIPDTFDFGEALKTAFIQILALLVIVLIVAVILVALGLFVPDVNRARR